MSVGDEIVECPLCMEQLEMDDLNFFPCTCGYQICRFCWHRIRTDENGLCPACRKQYSEDPAEFKPLTDDELQRIKKERKQKDLQRKQKAAENRKHLANVRVVQKNLVFVVGLSTRLADPEVLKKHEYFGKFGKIHKVVINQSTSYAGSQGPSASAYVTYHKMEDALRTIQAVNNVYVDGRTLKASLGTTKYCSHFLKGTQCMKSDCMYLHELGEQCASFTKEEMQQGRHQEYEQMLHENFLNSQNAANHGAGVAATTTPSKGSSSQPQPLVTNRKKTSSPTEDSQQQQQQQQQNSPPTTSHLQHSSNKEAWPSLQSKPDKITNGTKNSSTPPPTAKSETLHNRAPGNHRVNTHNGSQSIPSTKPVTPTEPKTQPVQSTAAVPPVIGSSRKHLFGDPVNADSLFGSSGFPTHRNPNKPSVVPMAPAPQATEFSPPSTEIPDTIPVSSSTDWQAAFGFGSSAQTTASSNDDDLGFDPWDESSKALADLIEKETLINPFNYPPQRHPPGFQLPPMPTFNPSQLKTEPVGTSKMLGLMQYTQAGDMPQATPHNDSFRNLLSSSTAVPRSSPSLSGAPTVQNDSFNMKDWQDGLKALLPNINISFGAAPSPSQPIHQHGAQNGWSNSNTPDWLAQDPAIVTSGNLTDGNSQQLSESPPHWMRSLQQLTENDSSTTLSSTANHRLPFVQQFQFRGAAWPTQSQTPPPGFSAPLRPATQATEPQIAQGLK